MYDPRSLVIGGGVSANTDLRENITKLLKDNYEGVTLYKPEIDIATDNAVMIALCAFTKTFTGLEECKKDLVADPKLSL